MSSITLRFFKYLRFSVPRSLPASLLSGARVQRSSSMWFSTLTSDNDTDHRDPKNNEDEEDDHIFGENVELQPQGVDPRRGWNFRGVHKAIICEKVGQIPVQKILRNGRTVTIFTVGTGGMYDQRIIGANDLPKPAQWH